MIGMRSTPMQDLQELQPELQSMQQPMPQPMPMPQMRQPMQEMPQASPVPMMQNPSAQPMPQPMPMPQMGQAVEPNQPAAPTSPTKQSIVKKAVKKAGGKTEGTQTKDQGVMKWMMDYLNKRHETSLNHEREVLKSILEEQRQRGGGPPASMEGNAQAYYDNTRNTGNIK